MTPKLLPVRSALRRRHVSSELFPFRGRYLPIDQLLSSFSAAIPFCRDEKAWLALFGLCLFEYGSSLCPAMFAVLLEKVGLTEQDTTDLLKNRSALLEYPALAQFIQTHLAPGGQFWRGNSTVAQGQFSHLGHLNMGSSDHAFSR